MHTLEASAPLRGQRPEPRGGGTRLGPLSVSDEARLSSQTCGLASSEAHPAPRDLLAQPLGPRDLKGPPVGNPYTGL